MFRIIYILIFFVFPPFLIPRDKKITSRSENQKYLTEIGKFVYAGVFEGTFTYGFQRKNGKILYFRSKFYEDEERIPYDLTDDGGMANGKFLNHTFKIYYIKKYESSDEDEEKRWINEIIKIKLIAK